MPECKELLTFSLGYIASKCKEHLTYGGLLVSTALVLVLSQLYLQKQAVKGDDEYKDENPFYKLILAIAIIVGVIVSIGSWIDNKG
ncbi:MAG: hypothetical protein ACOX4Q_00040 [Syntrophomonadales bacterium]|jgi:hypothetical protein